MKKFRQMPDHAVPKEWAPDEGEPKYVTAMRLVRRFNELKHSESYIRLAVLIAVLECAPAPIYARWAFAIVAIIAYTALWFKIKSVQRQARAIEDLNPPQIRVREEEQPAQDAPLQEQKA